jgi:VanZ family protein
VIEIIRWRAAVAIVYALGIFALSSLPLSLLGRIGLTSLMINLGHVPLFAGLGAVVFAALIGPLLRCVAAAALLCAAVAVADEWYQQFVPGRVPDLGDLVSDGLGIALGIGFVAVLRVARSRARTGLGKGGIEE